MALSQHIELLGESADEDVARVAGVSVAEVRAYREKRGIPAPLARPSLPAVQPTLFEREPAPSGRKGRRPAAERESEVVALLGRRGALRKRDIEAALGWTEPVAGKVLGELVGRGAIVHTDPNHPRSGQQSYALPGAEDGSTHAASQPSAPAAPKLRAAASSPVSAPGIHPLDRVRARVGTMPDAEIAALAGVSIDEVKQYRREHSIAPFLRAPPSVASPSKVGTAPARVGSVHVTPERAPLQQVSVLRRTIGDQPVEETVRRTAVETQAPPVSPLHAFRDRLGTVADQVIADETGIARTAVGEYRRSLGIAAYDGFRKGPRGAAPQPAPAPETPRTSGSVIDEYASLLGTASDAEIAAVVGVTRAAVTNYRNRLGIAPFNSRGPLILRNAQAAPVPAGPVAEAALPEVAPAPRSPVVAALHPASSTVDQAPTGPTSARMSKLDAHLDIVGVLSDAAVASRVGMTPEGVRMFRRRHGIPAASPVPSRVEPATPVGPEAMSAASTPALLVESPVATPIPAPAPAVPPSMVAPVEQPRSPSPAAPVAVSKPPPPVSQVADVRPVDFEGTRGISEGADYYQTYRERAEPVSAPVVAAALTRSYIVTAARENEDRRFVAIGVDMTDALANAAGALARRTDGPWRVRVVREFLDALVAEVPAVPRAVPTAQPAQRAAEAIHKPAVVRPGSIAVATTPENRDEPDVPVLTGADLIAYRKRTGLLQREVGARLGRGQSMISNAERNPGAPLRAALQEGLARVLAEEKG